MADLLADSAADFGGRLTDFLADSVTDFFYRSGRFCSRFLAADFLIEFTT